MTDDTSTNPPTEPEVASAAPQIPDVEPLAPPAEAPAPAPPSAPLTPYRTAPEALWPPVTARRPSLLGATIFVSGVLLWAFLVMGELTTSYAPGRHSMLVGEALGVVFVLGISAAAWRAAMLRNLAASVAPSPMAAYARAAVVAGGAIVMWWIVVACATAFGKAAGKNVDGPITAFLLIVSVALALGGRRLAGLHGPAPTPRKRTIARLLWAGASLLTLVAVIEVMAS